MTHEYVICPFSIAFMIMEIEKTVKGFNNCNVVAPTWYVHIIIRVKGTMQLHSTSIYGPDQGNRKRWMQGFLPEKGPSIFSCLDLILWPNVCNIFGDDFVPHHLIFYEIF